MYSMFRHDATVSKNARSNLNHFAYINDPYRIFKGLAVEPIYTLGPNPTEPAWISVISD